VLTVLGDELRQVVADFARIPQSLVNNRRLEPLVGFASSAPQGGEVADIDLQLKLDRLPPDEEKGRSITSSHGCPR
jgi:hypothetical protein